MMIEEILPGLYKIEVPLPGSPLKALNSYLIKDQGRFLIIDTGMNRPECMSAMSSGLEELGVDLKKTDFFITHLHADHLGLVSSLVTDTSTIYFNQPDAASVESGGDWYSRIPFADENGFREDECRKALDNHPGNRYGARGNLNFHIVKEGDEIDIGDYSFECVETPGHTRGHTCLYEPDKKLLMSGDHILIDITPNISLWSYDENPLNEYLDSLDKVYDLEIKLVLPGHRRAIDNCQGRIEELKHHHEARANEVLAILGKDSQNAFQIASQMTWDMDYASFELFPPSQKWFAFGEAIAHLKYLEDKGKVQRQRQEQEVIFSLKN
ncbi:MBL fold metallo-hydrolase [Chloroflexota bacterium]